MACLEPTHSRLQLSSFGRHWRANRIDCGTKRARNEKMFKPLHANEEQPDEITQSRPQAFLAPASAHANTISSGGVTPPIFFYPFSWPVCVNCLNPIEGRLKMKFVCQFVEAQTAQMPGEVPRKTNCPSQVFVFKTFPAVVLGCWNHWTRSCVTMATRSSMAIAVSFLSFFLLFFFFFLTTNSLGGHSVWCSYSTRLYHSYK